MTDPIYLDYNATTPVAPAAQGFDMIVFKDVIRLPSPGSDARADLQQPGAGTRRRTIRGGRADEW